MRKKTNKFRTGNEKSPLNPLLDSNVEKKSKIKKKHTEYYDYVIKNYVTVYPDKYYLYSAFYEFNDHILSQNLSLSNRFKKIYPELLRAIENIDLLKTELFKKNPRPLIDKIGLIALYQDKITWFRSHFRKNDHIYKRYPFLAELINSFEINVQLLRFYNDFYKEKIDFENQKFFFDLFLNDSIKVYYQIFKEEKEHEASSDPVRSRAKRVNIVYLAFCKMLEDKRFRNNVYIKKLKNSKENSMKNMCTKLEKAYYNFFRRRNLTTKKARKIIK